MKATYRILITLVIILITLGVVLVLGASNGIRKDYSMLFSHLVKVAVALGAMLYFASFPYEKYKKHSKKIMFAIIILLVLTLIIGIAKKGASRWLNVGLFSFQPAELAKIFIIIHLANLIEKKGKLIRDFKNGFVHIITWLFVVVGLIVLQPNLSTSILIMFVGFSMLFVAGAGAKHLIVTTLITGILGLMLLFSFNHSRERLLSHFGYAKEESIDLQSYQSSVALGSGGLTGKGIGHSRQSDLFLPEAYGDFIYAILGEQLGFIGTVLVLLIYLAIFVLGVLISFKCPDVFGKMLGFGLTLSITVNAVVNAAVVSNTIPVTGITLPFVSFGGTSIVTFGFAVGIIINIALTLIKSREAVAANEVLN
ncbi:MAG: FtsW/RodA/SpoVE family cell cycle protein [bacterium]